MNPSTPPGVGISSSTKDPPVSDDTPTQRFETPATPPPEAHTDERKTRLPLIAVIALVVVLLGRGNAITTAASTSSPVPTVTVTAPPVPVPTVTVTVKPAPSGGGGGTAPSKPNGNNVLITGYSISPTVVDCSSTAPAGAADLTISWKSVNGNDAFFGVNTVDAQAGGEGWNLPTTGTNHDFPSGAGDPYTYQCGDAQESFTITVIGNGSKQSLTITVKRK